MPPPQTQPLAGTAFPQTQPRQTPLLALQAPRQTQPLAGDARGDDSDDNDYEGLDSRAAVGEQSFEEETAQAERQHQGEGSEAEEIAFKQTVAAVVRVAAKANRFAMAPHQRFRPAVGGGGAPAELDMHVHMYACRMGEGVEFTLTSLSETDVQGRWFVPAQNFGAITRRYDVLERQREAIVPSWAGGW